MLKNRQFSRKNRCLIVVPAFNEASRLPAFLPELIQAARQVKADLLGMNDCSTDDTANLFQEYGIPVLTHATQMGYGVSLQTCYKYARQQGYDYLIQIDGDGQHDPRFIPAILQALRQQEVDVVIGSRFLEHGEHALKPHRPLYYGTFWRRLGIRLFRSILYLFTLSYYTDPTSGYVGINRRTIEFFCGKCFPPDYPDADLIFTLLRNRFRVTELPVYMYANHSRGKMHRGCRPFWYVIKVSLALFVESIRVREERYG